MGRKNSVALAKTLYVSIYLVVAIPLINRMVVPGVHGYGPGVKKTV
jgi:hypothetical protein